MLFVNIHWKPRRATLTAEVACERKANITVSESKDKKGNGQEEAKSFLQVMV